jgi:hypothetical protein
VKGTPEYASAALGPSGRIVLQSAYDRQKDACGSQAFEGYVDAAPKPLFTKPDEGCMNWGEMDEDYLVWEQDHDPDIVRPDWTIYSYSFKERKVRVLGKWSDFTDVLYDSNQVFPHIDHGWVIWGAVAKGNEPVVIRAPADGSAKAEILIHHAVTPSYVYPLVAFANAADVEHLTLDVLNLESGQQRTMRPLPSHGAITLSDHAVMLTSSTGGAEVTSLDTGKTKQLSPLPDSQWPAASHDLIAWYDNQHSYVYRVSTGTMTVLGNRHSANWVGVAGTYVWWTVDKDPQDTTSTHGANLIVARVP